MGGPLPKSIQDTDDLQRQISEENEKKVAGMTDEERDQERREIIEQFGVGIGALLQKAREARERRSAQDGNESDQMDTDAHSEQDRSDTSSEGMPCYFLHIC
jgi:hypothetical protein